MRYGVTFKEGRESEQSILFALSQTDPGFSKTRQVCGIAARGPLSPTAQKFFPISPIAAVRVVSGNQVCSFPNFIILSRPKDGRCTEEGGSINNKLIYFSIFLFLYFVESNFNINICLVHF